jgi:KDO transferase-3
MDSTPETAVRAQSPCIISGFEKCRNIERGAVFIIASGNSAKNFPIEQFADIPMITVNGAISMFIGTGIKPFFYTCTDTSFSKQQPELFSYAMRNSQRVALWSSHARQMDVDPPSELFLLSKAPKQTLADWVFSRNKDLIRSRAIWRSRNRSIGFSKNLVHGFFDARTVAYLALQIAYHVGFTKVFLVGVDLDPSAGRFYETNTSSISPCGLDQYFQSRILPSLKLMSKEIVGSEFSVYNLSTSSRIPPSVIPTATIDELGALINSA